MEDDRPIGVAALIHQESRVSGGLELECAVRGIQPAAGSGGGSRGEAPDPGDRGGGRPVGREELTPGGTPRLPVQSPRGRDGHPPPPGPPDGS